MSGNSQPLWGPRQRHRPGSVAFQCGAILFSMGLTVFEWDRRLIEGPPEEQLRPVQATLLMVDCEVKRGSSQGAAHSSEYGRPAVSFEYLYEGQRYQSQRFHRQPNTEVGSMAECRALVEGLRAQPSVQAWIDPARPEFAVLSKNLRDQSLNHTVMGIGISLGALGVYRLLRSRGWTRDND